MSTDHHVTGQVTSIDPTYGNHMSTRQPTYATPTLLF